MNVAVLVVAAVVVIIATPIWSPFVGLGPPEAPEPGMLVDLDGGHRINVSIRGEGPAVVLVHGRPGTGYDWEPLPRQLVESGFQVVTYDRVGYGYSSRREPGESYGFATNAAELIDLLDALKLSRVDLIGWSFGGGVAQVAAQRHPDRIRRLLLVAAVGSYSGDGSDTWAERILRMTEPMQAWGVASGFLSGPGLRQMGRVYFAGPPPNGWVRHMQSTLALNGAVHTWVQEGRSPGIDRLQPEALTVPTTIVNGTNDVTAEFAVAERLRDRIQRARLVRVEGGSHMIPNTHPDLVAAELGDPDIGRR